ncbi:MAG: hypothetical protein CL670_02810 [Balneola sp.]|jgi:hypothetical protein|nr:hypothetical protein [Balneola sp.]MBE78065.1 hypothetical protein [Balneola sp.]HBX65057.1 hypothetical protein [Balneolaceae bacterium]|tara:strand:+ start:924 stop:1295 length:372 start_codon:yes stop_codon:yes gene_type:complete
MKSFAIEIESIAKGPKELTYQLPIQAKIQKQIPGKDRPDYFLAELETPVFWVDEKQDINTEVTHLILCTKKKSQFIASDMKEVIVAIAYVINDAVLTEHTLDFKKCKYVATGKANALKKWGLF